MNILSKYPLRVGDKGNYLYSESPLYWSPRLEESKIISVDPDIKVQTESGRIFIDGDKSTEGNTFFAFVRKPPKQLNLFHILKIPPCQ